MDFEAEDSNLFSNEIDDLSSNNEDNLENISTIDSVLPEIEIVSSSELEISDKMLEEEVIGLPLVANVDLLTLDEATQKIPKSVLEVLKESFNGSLEECRKLRESDRIF